MNNAYKNHIEDSIEELIDRGIEAKETADSSNDSFDKGRSLGYYEVLDFLLNQTEIFGIKEELKNKIKNFTPVL